MISFGMFSKKAVRKLSKETTYEGLNIYVQFWHESSSEDDAGDSVVVFDHISCLKAQLCVTCCCRDSCTSEAL